MNGGPVGGFGLRKVRPTRVGPNLASPNILNSHGIGAVRRPDYADGTCDLNIHPVEFLPVTLHLCAGAHPDVVAELIFGVFLVQTQEIGGDVMMSAQNQEERSHGYYGAISSTLTFQYYGQHGQL